MNLPLRYLAALKGALFDPERFFSSPRAELRPVPFALFTVSVGLALGLVLGHLLVPQSTYDAVRAQAQALADANPQLWPLVDRILWFVPAGAAEARRRLLRDLAFTPLVALAALYVSAWLTHALLLAMRQNRGGFRATLDAVGWGLAPFAFAAVPEIGSIAASLWTIGLTSYAVSRLHGIATRHALIAVVGPPLLILGAAFATFALYVAMLLAR